MLYRARQARHLAAGICGEHRRNSLHQARRAGPQPTEDYEKDAASRIRGSFQFGGAYYLTYTGYNKKMRSFVWPVHRLGHWDRKGVIIPAYKGNWNVKVDQVGGHRTGRNDGKYWMYFLAQLLTARSGGCSSTDLLHWTEATMTPALPIRPVTLIRASPSRPCSDRNAGWNRADLQRRDDKSSIAPASPSSIARIHGNYCAQ